MIHVISFSLVIGVILLSVISYHFSGMHKKLSVLLNEAKIAALGRALSGIVINILSASPECGAYICDLCYTSVCPIGPLRGGIRGVSYPGPRGNGGAP